MINCQSNQQLFVFDQKTTRKTIAKSDRFDCFLRFRISINFVANIRYLIVDIVKKNKHDFLKYS